MCLASGAFPGCITRCFTSRFLPPRPAKVAIYATRCRHFLSFSFFGRTNNLGICEATKDSSGASPRMKERRLHLEEPNGHHLRGVVTLLAFKCSSEGCRPWIETQLLSETMFSDLDAVTPQPSTTSTSISWQKKSTHMCNVNIKWPVWPLSWS